MSAACGAPAFIATATAAAAGYGLGVLIGGVDHHLNDNRMQLAFARQVGFKEENSPHASAGTPYILSHPMKYMYLINTLVLAKKALTEVEVIRYLAAVVGGIEAYIPVSLIYTTFLTRDFLAHRQICRHCGEMVERYGL